VLGRRKEMCLALSRTLSLPHHLPSLVCACVRVDVAAAGLLLCWRRTHSTLSFSPSCRSPFPPSLPLSLPPLQIPRSAYSTAATSGLTWDSTHAWCTWCRTRRNRSRPRPWRLLGWRATSTCSRTPARYVGQGRGKEGGKGCVLLRLFSLVFVVAGSFDSIVFMSHHSASLRPSTHSSPPLPPSLLCSHRRRTTSVCACILTTSCVCPRCFPAPAPIDCLSLVVWLQGGREGGGGVFQFLFEKCACFPKRLSSFLFFFPSCTSSFLSQNTNDPS